MSAVDEKKNANPINLGMFDDKEFSNALSIIEFLPSMLFIADSEGSCNYFNNSWLEFTGRTLNQELGKGFTAGVFNEDLNSCIDVFKDNFSKRTAFTMEFRLKNSKGKYCWIRSNCAPLFNSNKDFKGYVGVCFNIQDMKESEETNRKLYRAVEQSPLSIVITDIDGTIEYVNPKFTELTGYPSDEAIGKNPRVLKSGYHESSFYVNLWDTILSGNTWLGEIHNIKKDGAPFIEEASINPIKSLGGKITHFVAIKQDITKRKANEEELKHKNIELEKFNKLAVDRELKMIELKKEIIELKKKILGDSLSQ